MADTVKAPGGYCISCGSELDPDHRYCPRCGAERWVIPDSRAPTRPPPVAGTGPFLPSRPRPVAAPSLRWLPFLFAAGAIFWLVELTQFAAIVAAPAGRDQLRQALVTAGLTQDVGTVVIVESAIVAAFEVSAAALHAAAYFGLRKMRAWGWIAGVIVAAGWSLVLVGIPILLVLLRRTTRELYGIS